MAEATNSSCPISKRIILCVDDNPMILQYEKTLLEVSGYTVLAASSGKDALRFVTTCAFDLVILDYSMPEMNGHEVALEITGKARPGNHLDVWRRCANRCTGISRCFRCQS